MDCSHMKQCHFIYVGRIFMQRMGMMKNRAQRQYGRRQLNGSAQNGNERQKKKKTATGAKYTAK